MSETMSILYGLAESQSGYFTTAQAVLAGISRRVVSRRAQRGDIEKISHGLYRLTNFPAQPFEDVVAACLWAGEGSVASHETALAIHTLSDAMPAKIHLTTPRSFRGHRAGVVIHNLPLEEKDRELRKGIPITTIGRTLKDVATSSDPSLVEQAIRQALSQAILSRRLLRKLAEDVPTLAPLIVEALTEKTQ